MTPEQKLIAKLVLIALILLSCFGAGFYLRDVQADRDTNKIKLDAATATINMHEAFEQKIDQRDAANRSLNQKLYTLQTESSKAYYAQLSENTRLAADLGVAQRMSLRGSRCPDPAAVGSNASPGVADDNGILLSAETRQFVFDLRGSILTDKAIIRGLREHIAYLERQIAEHQQLHHAK